MEYVGDFPVSKNRAFPHRHALSVVLWESMKEIARLPDLSTCRSTMFTQNFWGCLVSNPSRTRDRSAFTLVEIMIVVAIIGLLTVLALPSFVKARKQSQGRRTLNDCRQQDAAIDQWAMETCQADGATVNTTGAATYLKTAWKTQDLLGKSFTLNAVGTGQILISTATKSSLAGVGIDWGIY